MSDFFRVQLGVVSRSEGHSAAKRAAYQSCGRIVDHEGEAFDFTRKAAEHIRTIMLTPQGAPEWAHHPESLWQRAAAAEKRIDAQEARILDFSMPRAVPSALWDRCVCYVYQPFIDMGMAIQVDIHDSPATDGGRNVNVHGLVTLREFAGDSFASRKNRVWNDRFRERSGRVIRGMFAERLTAFCRQHDIAYQGDARSNVARNLPHPEPELSKWNFEAWKRGEAPEAFAALLSHRARRRGWEAAKAEEIEAALELAKVESRIRERRQRRIAPAGLIRVKSGLDRRAAVLRVWHQVGWIDAEAVAAIASTRFDEMRSCLWINLKDGSTLIDGGDNIALRGRLTWAAAMETAAAAARHGWTEVTVSGDQAYKDAVTTACMLRGLKVTNHALSAKAHVALDRMRAQQPERLDDVRNSSGALPPSTSRAAHLSSNQSLSSRDIHLELSKQIVPGAIPSVEAAEAAGTPNRELKAKFQRPSNPIRVVRAGS